MLNDTDIALVGLGLHGSWVARALIKLTPRSLLLWDGDNVEPHNLQSQNYTDRHLGAVKSLATAGNMKAAQRRIPVTTEGMWLPSRPVLGRAASGIVVCCADSMEVRRRLAQQVGWLYGEAALFIETRSLGNDGYLHAFNAASEYVDHYTTTCFPDVVAEIDCGGAGTVAMGMMMASLTTTIVSQWKSSERAQLPLNEHCVQLGYGHQARPFILQERR